MTFCPPAQSHVPEHVGTYGDEVADLAATAGLHLDPEQKLVIDAMYAHDGYGRLVATEVGCAAPRQNIKTHVGKAAALADLVLFDEPLGLWTAQLKTTSAEVYANAEGTGLADLFENFDHLSRLLARNGLSADSDEPSITLRRPAVGMPAPQLRFMARSARGGRGLTGRRVTYDEALFLKSSMTQAMTPTLSARTMSGAVQLRYLGSAGILESEVWREVRDRGRSGSERYLAWFEWLAPSRPCENTGCDHSPDTAGCALDDPALIAAANLALGRRISIEWVLGTERHSLTPEAFMTERLGWWQDPPNRHGGDLDVARWLELAGSPPPLVEPVWGADVDEAGIGWVAVVWRRPDGDLHCQVLNRETVSSLKGRVETLHAKWRGTVFAGGGALAALGDEAESVSGSEFAAACVRFEELLGAGRIHHCDQDEMNAAVQVAQWRSVGTSGERAWRLKDCAGIGPLAALTRALHGLSTSTSRTRRAVFL